MFGGQIPTSGGNSRLAALNARKRPTVDVNDMGIAIEAGGGRTPMLTNRVESLSDEGLAGVSQRGFDSGRTAVREALDASGRTYRTNLIDQDLARAREQKAMDYALAAEDDMARAKSGAAVEALQARNKADIYFSPSASKMREDDVSQKMDLYKAQTAGTRAAAAAATRGHELKATADIEAARLGAGSRALATFDEIRAGLDPEVPEDPGIFWDTPAIPNDQDRIDELDQRTMDLIKSLGLSGDIPQAQGPRDPNAITGGGNAALGIQAMGSMDPSGTASTGDQRTQAITAYAQQHGIDPQLAERILVHRNLIPGAQ